MAASYLQRAGCKERFIVIDGNEKMFRSICFAEKSKIAAKNGYVNTYDICIRNPIRGNQYSNASKFCERHIDGKSGKSKMVINIRPVTRSINKNLPLTIISIFHAERHTMAKCRKSWKNFNM